ncbi:sulfite oxidase-like oxidoreductase [Aureimonas glaciei]|uniref:Sulfite oxidase-like oxidoreductase n=1 Tax=Aureimonas glaciei TaxID=1776957 RepID=A0A916XW86_9HYPH|nr:sulfite oxidase-like oxidoreductase [Aureimonas glaciei]GGD16319.1 sulfite oxidase-like oxidoreductase [Aureimonas glaciei]
MADEPEHPDSKLTRTKQEWAEQGKFLTGRSSGPEADRLPPGQHLVQNWPILDLGLRPDTTPATFKLRIDGAVDAPALWDFSQVMALKQTEAVSDIHCVTTWSRYDNRWSGVAITDLLDIVRPKSGAAFVVLHSDDGYTTNLTLADFAAPGAMLAHAWEGRPLAAEHGGPLRVVVPHLYFWKSAKWLKRIEFRTTGAPGFWEVRGYHNRGDPWNEERYSD